MNWKEYGMKGPWSNFRCYPGIYLKGLRKTTTNFTNDSCVRAEMRTGHFLNTGQKRYQFSQLARLGVGKRKLVLIQLFYNVKRNRFIYCPVLLQPHLLIQYSGVWMPFHKGPPLVPLLSHMNPPRPLIFLRSILMPLCHLQLQVTRPIFKVFSSIHF
jgi:hypothetical protein